MDPIIGQIIVAAITAIPATVAAILGMKNRTSIQEVKHATDGMKDALVTATSAAASAEGHEAGRQVGRAESKEDARP